jgi:hypothetical protein
VIRVALIGLVLLFVGSFVIVMSRAPVFVDLSTTWTPRATLPACRPCPDPDLLGPIRLELPPAQRDERS